MYITLIYMANHRATLPAVRHHLYIWFNYTSWNTWSRRINSLKPTKFVAGKSHPKTPWMINFFWVQVVIFKNNIFIYLYCKNKWITIVLLMIFLPFLFTKPMGDLVGHRFSITPKTLCHPEMVLLLGQLLLELMVMNSMLQGAGRDQSWSMIPNAQLATCWSYDDVKHLGFFYIVIALKDNQSIKNLM